MSDDAEARRRRAARLRQQIAGLTGKPAGEPISDPKSTADVPAPSGRRSPPRVRPMSPRALIEERMRELDRDDKSEERG